MTDRILGRWRLSGYTNPSMKQTIKPFDASKHFASDEAQARLIADALTTGDETHIANARKVVDRAKRGRRSDP